MKFALAIVLLLSSCARPVRMADLSAPHVEHKDIGYCGLCEARKAPKCKLHSNPWYCGWCGKVKE